MKYIVLLMVILLLLGCNTHTGEEIGGIKSIQKPINKIYALQKPIGLDTSTNATLVFNHYLKVDDIKKKKTLITIDSSENLSFINKKKWEYKQLDSKRKKGFDILVLNSRHRIRQNRTHLKIILDCQKLNKSYLSCKEVSYKKILDGFGKNIVNLTKISNRIYRVDYPLPYDPSYENVNITDYIAWYNFTNYINGDDYEDWGTNSKDIDSGTSYLVNDSSHCVGGNCMTYNGAGTGSISYLFGNPISDNWTISAQFNIDYQPQSIYSFIFGGDNPSISLGNPTTKIFCGMEQSTGTQYPSVTVLDGYSYDTNYVVICFKNGSKLCGQYNNNTASCIDLDGTQKNNEWYSFGRQGKNLSGIYTSGGVAYDRALNASERIELYNCLSTRGNIDEGCSNSGSSDSCTLDCTSGTHTFDCSDNCELTSNTDASSCNHVCISGSGTFIGLRYLKDSQHITISGGCKAKV